MKQRSPRRLGYTLIELIAATGSAAVLMGGMASTLYIAGHALDVDNGAAAQEARATAAVGRMLGDLRHATAFTERTSTAVTFTVPDRSGDDQPDTLRYAWSGDSGDPLTVAYNGGDAVALVDDVRALDLTFLERFVAADTITDPDAPVVAYVVSSATSPTIDESERSSLVASWGFNVTMIGDSASQSDFNELLATAVVVYVSDDASDLDIGSKLADVTLGIVSELPELVDELGFATSTVEASWLEVDVIDLGHEITDEFSADPFALVTTSGSLDLLSGTIASGIDTIIELDGSPYLVTLEFGATTHTGDSAAGRRVYLPLGESISVSDLTSAGKNLLQEALLWAMTPGSAAGGTVVYHDFTEAKAGTNTTSLTVDSPAASEGDLLIAAVATDGSRATSLAAPSGWNTIDIGVGASSAVTLGVWWKIATSVEPANHQFTWSSGEHAYGWIMRFSGHDPTAPIHAFDSSTGSASTATAPEVTTSINSAFILRIGGFDDGDVTVDDTGMASHTTITMDEAATYFTVSGGAAYAEQDAAGGTGTASFALTASEQHRTLTIAIAPDTED